MHDSELEQKYLIPENYSPIPKFEEVVPGPSDKGVILWRYLDLAKFIALVTERKLHFTRADVFEDKHEGSITNPMFMTQKKQFEGKPFNIQTLSNWRRNLKECTFISCWCMGDESEAMWKLYCGEEQGVAITAVYEDIEAALPSSGFKIAPIKYIDYRTEGFHQGNYYFPFFHKRSAFAHEREVRIVQVATDQYDDGSMPTGSSDPSSEAQRQQLEEERQQKVQLKTERGKGISIQLDVINTIQEIVVHPDAPEWYYGVVDEVVKRLIPELIGRVRWSSMRTEPVY